MAKQILCRRLLLNSFKSGDVNVSGKKGSGKDLLFYWIINKRKKPYISNVQYTTEKNYNKFTDAILTLPTNRSKIAKGEGCKYTWKYPEGTDIYISDAGVIFPSWDYKELNKEYPSIPLFIALTRHIGDFRVHTNSQSPLRIWDKLREQQDVYIVCLNAKVLFGKIATIKGRYYTNIDSATAQIPAPTGKRTEKIAYQGQHGLIKSWSISFIMKRYKYNDRIYKEILAQPGEDQNK